MGEGGGVYEVTHVYVNVNVAKRLILQLRGRELKGRRILYREKDMRWIKIYFDGY